MYFTVSPVLAKMPSLSCLLDGRIRFGLPGPGSKDAVMVGWGRKRSFHRAAAYASRRALPCLSLEDGFLRSIGMGRDEPPMSIVVDDLGIYYDAARASRLEIQIAGPHSDAQVARARELRARWRDGRVSKYNQAREFDLHRADRRPYVLVADQTHGDASIRHGLADASSFQRMLDAALAENPDCTVLLKIHPEVMAGRKRGHFDLDAVGRLPQVQVLGRDVHPAFLIAHAEAVYVVTSQMGFEGLLWGKRVRTFGMPFYAGWGLTEDDLPPPARRQPVSLENLVHAALVEYPRYLDPETGVRCEPERLIEWLALKRSMRERFPQRLHALGFSLWKRPIVRAFFQGSEVKFLRDARAVQRDETRVVWGSRSLPTSAGSDPAAGGANVPDHVVRLEDGQLVADTLHPS